MRYYKLKVKTAPLWIMGNIPDEKMPQALELAETAYVRNGQILAEATEVPDSVKFRATKYVAGKNVVQSGDGNLVSDKAGIVFQEGSSLHVQEPLLMNESETRAYYFAANFPDIMSLYHKLEELSTKRGIQKMISATDLQKKCEESDIAKGGWILFAESSPPIDGVPPDSKLLAQSAQSLSFDAKGRINHRERSSIVTVSKGDPVLELIPGVPAVDGMTIMGDVLAAERPEKFYYKPGDNLEPSKENPRVYVAKIDGALQFQEDKIHVHEILEIDGDVDMQTGNIRYKGSVHIHGNITTGMSVECGGDLVVAGSVEPCDIQAGGSVFVSGGIIGKGDRKITAREFITCSFLQNATIHTRKDVIVSQSVVNSIIHAGDSILVTGEPGHIISGMLVAGSVIEANIAGSLLGSFLLLRVGLSKEIEDMIRKLNREMNELSEEIAERRKAIMIAAGIADLGLLKEKLPQLSDEAQMKIRKALTELSSRKTELLKKREKKEHLHSLQKSQVNVQIQIHEAIEKGVQVVVGTQKLTIEKRRKRVIFKPSADGSRIIEISDTQ